MCVVDCPLTGNASVSGRKEYQSFATIKYSSRSQIITDSVIFLTAILDIDIMSSNAVNIFLVLATIVSFLFPTCLATSDPNTFGNNTQDLKDENRAAAVHSPSLSDLVYGGSSHRQSDLGHLTAEDFQNALTVEDSQGVTNPNWIVQSANLFEGDIAGVNRSTREMRNAIIGLNFRWPNAVIPYLISSSFTPTDRSVIAKAMTEYHNKTCIRFVPRTIQPDYIVIKTTGSGCNSNIGRTGGAQVVSLDQGCVHVSLIVHELMHTAGFFHEQSRTDRDDYVVINFGNIQEGTQNNFNKFGPNEIDLLGTPYDTGSVMHYDQFAFAKDRRIPTIYSKTGSTLGNKVGFSQNDVLKLNIMYQCHPDDETTTAIPATIPTTEPTTVPTTTTPTTTTPTTTTPTTTETTTLTTGITKEITTTVTTTVGSTQVPFTETTSTSKVTLGPECVDTMGGCDVWLDDGFCIHSVNLMSAFCKKTCGFCSGPDDEVCDDITPYCSQWASSGLCVAIQGFMLANCPKSCNACKAN